MYLIIYHRDWEWRRLFSSRFLIRKESGYENSDCRLCWFDDFGFGSPRVYSPPTAGSVESNVVKASDDISLEQVLLDFRANLEEKASAGDSVAHENIQEFDRLSEAQRTELADYLVGKSEVLPPKDENMKPESSDGVLPEYSSGNFSWIWEEATPEEPLINQEASESIYHISGRQTLKFLGIRITEHEVYGFYTSDGKPKEILAHECAVKRNYDIFTEITTAKSSSYVHGDGAYFSCQVRIKRGAPSPWGNIAWSTVERIHFIGGNGKGKVVRNGSR